MRVKRTQPVLLCLFTVQLVQDFLLFRLWPWSLQHKNTKSSLGGDECLITAINNWNSVSTGWLAKWCVCVCVWLAWPTQLSCLSVTYQMRCARFWADRDMIITGHALFFSFPFYVQRYWHLGWLTLWSMVHKAIFKSETSHSCIYFHLSKRINK